jgi:hypothetical protein
VSRTLSSRDSLERNLGIISDFMREQDGKNVVQVFKDDTGTRRVLLGRGKNGFYGLKVSQPGVDVYDAEDSQLVFNSQQNVFKIVQDPTTVPITAPANTTNTTTIAHGLSYKPAVVAYLEAGIASGARTPLPTWTALTRDDANGFVMFETWINVEVDETNIYIRFFNATSGAIGPLNVTIYLLQESAGS